MAEAFRGIVGPVEEAGGVGVEVLRLEDLVSGDVSPVLGVAVSGLAGRRGVAVVADVGYSSLLPGPPPPPPVPQLFVRSIASSRKVLRAFGRSATVTTETGASVSPAAR